MDEFMDTVAERFGEVYGRRVTEVRPERLEAHALA